MLMKGAVLPGNSTVELKDFEIPKPGYGQVVVQTKATTICGSGMCQAWWQVMNPAARLWKKGRD